jgi:hypothetical protein
MRQGQLQRVRASITASGYCRSADLVTVAGLVAALLANAAIVFANGLPPTWYGLAGVLALTSTALELWSPRGTDDFTMATGNALVCWAFGAWLLPR